jgi:hypothetical protein
LGHNLQPSGLHFGSNLGSQMEKRVSMGTCEEKYQNNRI